MHTASANPLSPLDPPHHPELAPVHHPEPHDRPASPERAASGEGAASPERAVSDGGESAGGEQEVAAGRREVDELDDRIIALVEERVAVSARIQRARIAAGGRRVQLAREKEVIDRYSGSLGRPGAQLAMVLLGLCRGTL